MLPRLGREEESSMDGQAFPELKALLMNATPLSGIFQTTKLGVGKRQGIHDASF